MAKTPEQFVSRAGAKLDAALEAFGLDAAGKICADFGCNVGGFTDCLLHRGAAKVYALDTGYGELAWKLRKDPRVVVMERTNALHIAPPEPADIVVVDVAWTPQAKVIPVAIRWLKPGGRIVSLLKPHYELAKLVKRKPIATLSMAEARRVCREVCEALESAGEAQVLAVMQSQLLGKGGNAEFLLLLRAG